MILNLLNNKAILLMFRQLMRNFEFLFLFIILFLLSINTHATRVSGVHLVDVTTNTELGFLQNGDVIDLAVLPQINLSAIPNGTITKILFYVNGSLVRSEGVAPYAIAGDAAGVFNNWLHPGIGNHVFDFVAINGTDTGEVTTLNVQIINSGSNALYSLAEFTEPSCPNSINGTATINGFGGSLPYSFIWSTGATTQQISNLSTGTYTVTVTDNNSNSSQTTFSILFPQALIVNSVIKDESCFGIDGAVELAISGGTESYNILWSNAETESIIDGLSAGIYSVTITDYFGCSTSGSYTVNYDSLNAPFTVSELIFTESCFGNDGSISLYYAGGNSPHNVLWSNGSTSDVIINLSQGIYTASVTDANGCSNQYEYIVPFDPLLGTFSVSSSIISDKCYANNSGSINLSVSGGNAPYSFAWSNGSTSNPATGLSSGNYTVTITEQNGCSTIQNYFVELQNTDPSLVLNPVVNSESCMGSDGFYCS